jgi:hypothetical protein
MIISQCPRFVAFIVYTKAFVIPKIYLCYILRFRRSITRCQMLKRDKVDPRTGSECRGGGGG